MSKPLVKENNEHEKREEEKEEKKDRYEQLKGETGYALLVYFPTTCAGSMKDVISIGRELEHLNFKTAYCKDPPKKDLKKKLEETATTLQNGKHHCFVLFITGHGSESGVETNDSHVFISAEEIASHFKEGFIGKPKLFFIESCRGQKCPRAYRMLLEKNTVPAIQVPVDADILIAHSTTSGYVSISNQDGESFFIKKCVEVFKEGSSEKHVEEMMIEIKAGIAEMLYENNQQICGQVPCTWSTLRKKVFF